MPAVLEHFRLLSVSNAVRLAAAGRSRERLWHTLALESADGGHGATCGTRLIPLLTRAFAMFKAAGLFACMSLSTAGLAAEWTHFADCGQPGQQRIYSYQSSSVSRRGDEVRVTIRGDYSRVSGSRAQSGRLLWTLNCTARTFRERQRIDYAGRRVVERYNSPTAAMNISPGSVAERLFEKVCT